MNRFNLSAHGLTVAEVHHNLPPSFFSSGGSLRHGTSASEDETSDEATLVITSLP
jgi:hypothetical protein